MGGSFHSNGEERVGGDAAVGRPGSRPARAVGETPESATLLVVDDDELIRTIFRDALEAAGYRVLLACDGEEGIALYRRHIPALVVTDLVMPRKGGLFLIREIRAISDLTPIVVVTGGLREGKLSFLRTAGTFPGVVSLEKPVQLAQLVAVTGRLLASSRHPAAVPLPPTRPATPSP